MSATLILPTALRQRCDNARRVSTDSATVGEAIRELTARYPQAAELLVDDTGEVLGHVNIFVNDASIRDLQNEQTEISSGDEVVIVPALAGG